MVNRSSRIRIGAYGERYGLIIIFALMLGVLRWLRRAVSLLGRMYLRSSDPRPFSS
jgi:hypothetical protein